MTFEPGIIVRLATEEDLPTLVSMIDRLVEEQEAIGEPSQAEFITVGAKYGIKTGQAVVVAVDDSQLVGHLIWVAFPGGPKGEVVGLGTYVRPDYRKRGLGRRMQVYALHHLFDLGYEWVTGSVALKNPAAIALIAETGADITGYVIRWRRPRSLQPA